MVLPRNFREDCGMRNGRRNGRRAGRRWRDERRSEEDAIVSERGKDEADEFCCVMVTAWETACRDKPEIQPRAMRIIVV